MILLEELNNFMKKDLENISQLYVESVLTLMESPDNLTINGVRYNYSDSSLGNYTGIAYFDGKYAMSTQHGIDHYMFMRNLEDRKFDDVITNFENEEIFINSIQHSTIIGFRIWPKFKYYSFWIEPTSYFIDTIVNSLKAIGQNPENYTFEFMSYSKKDPIKMSFDELKKIPTTQLDRQLIENNYKIRKQNEAILAKTIFNKQQNTYGMKLDQPSFYKRSGD
jgi:hypothetical protein